MGEESEMVPDLSAVQDCEGAPETVKQDNNKKPIKSACDELHKYLEMNENRNLTKEDVKLLIRSAFQGTDLKYGRQTEPQSAENNIK